MKHSQNPEKRPAISSRVLGVHLRDSTMEFDLDQISGSQLTFDVDIQVGHKYIAKERVVIVSVRNRLVIFDRDVGADAASFTVSDGAVGTVEATFEGRLEIASQDAHKMTSERAEELTRRSGLALIYPYIRQFMTDVVGRAGIQPMYLPLLEQIPTQTLESSGE